LTDNAERERVLDDYLVASARLGDRSAVALVFKRWDRKFRAHAWRLLGDHEAARDAVQESWAEILRSLPRLADTRAFPAWAYRIVSRRCARAIGAANSRRSLEAAVAAEPAVPDETTEHGSDLDKVRAAVRALPPGQRAAVALFYFEEMSVAEAAVALDVPAGTVKTRLMHARRALRATLAGENHERD
jgi:RNA polymerase sigma-70 factor (ECF subfamily)